MKSESNEQKHVATTATKTHFTVQPGNGPTVSLLQVQHVTHYIEVMFFLKAKTPFFSDTVECLATLDFVVLCCQPTGDLTVE